MHRYGHGSIVLVIDSSMNENFIHYDANIELEILHNEMKERKLCWVKTLWTTRNDLDNRNIMLASVIKRLEEKVVTPLSMSSTTPECFILRIFSFEICNSDRIINTILKLNEDNLHLLNIKNFNVSTCKKYLWITSSGDQLEHSELTEINDTVILLNYSSAEVK